METEDRDLMGRLLTGKDKRSRPDQEVLFEDVLGAVGAKSSVLRRMGPPLALAAGVAIASVLLFQPEDQFTARGGGGHVRVFCQKEGARSVCQRGAQLFFEVSSPPERNFFAAFAVAPDGIVLWYFPRSDKGQSLNIQAGGEAILIDFSIDLGQEHPPGDYSLFGVFSSRPLSRDEIKAQVASPQSWFEPVAVRFAVE